MAAREVLEATGWRPGPLQHLLTFQPTPGMVDTPHALFVANAAGKVGDFGTARSASSAG